MLEKADHIALQEEAILKKQQAVILELQRRMRLEKEKTNAAALKEQEKANQDEEDVEV